MNISLNPWYYCNFSCDFCYLTKEQLDDRTCIDLTRLSEMLTEITNTYGSIDHVDVYGGEVALLPPQYFEEMTNILLQHTNSLNLVTNLSVINEITLDLRYTLSVSYDFEAREKHDLVYRNMGLLGREFSVLMLAGKKLLTQNPDEQIQLFNLLPNCKSVEIKPYSSNQANQHAVSDTDYEEFVKQWILSPIPKNFEFVNKYLLDRVVSDDGYSYSDDHIYITPSGSYAVLEFDLNDNEYFLELDNLDDYDQWCNSERMRVNSNQYCGTCDYNGKCLSEHLRTVKNLDFSCNGYIQLIRWYEKLEN